MKQKNKNKKDRQHNPQFLLQRVPMRALVRLQVDYVCRAVLFFLTKFLN